MNLPLRVTRLEVRARGRLKQLTGMTKLEADWQSRLQMRMLAGEIAWYRYEGVTLKLAPDTRYTPDFAVMLADGMLEMHEVKGYMRDDAAVKLKGAAQVFPFKFVLVRRNKDKSWKVEEV